MTTKMLNNYAGAKNLNHNEDVLDYVKTMVQGQLDLIEDIKCHFDHEVEYDIVAESIWRDENETKSLNLSDIKIIFRYKQFYRKSEPTR